MHYRYLCSNNRLQVSTRTLTFAAKNDKWDDIDLENKKVKIAHQMVDRPSETANRHAVRSDIMKGAKEAGKRVQPLSKHALGVINGLLENNGGNEWVLPNKGGKEPITTNRINENLKRICNKLGIKYYSSHGARFYAISAMYDAGVPEKEIQRMSGHTTPTIHTHCIHTKTQKQKPPQTIDFSRFLG